MFVAVYHRVGQLLRGKWSSRSWITQGYQKPFVFLCFIIKSPKLRRYLNGHLGAPPISLGITLTQVKMCFHRNIWTVQRCTQAVTYFIISQTNRVLQLQCLHSCSHHFSVSISRTSSKFANWLGGRRGSEVAFVLPTHPSSVQIWMLVKKNYFRKVELTFCSRPNCP